jgi:ribosome maturation factor RimP
LYICSDEKEKRKVRGQKVPSFYTKMLEKKVQELLGEALNSREDLFLISLKITPENIIEVIIDGDKGVKVEDCIFISRAIEHNLDREEEDFSLQVMSAGATELLTHIRQYEKHIGRKLNVITNSKEIEGVLTQINEKEITLEWKVREPKLIGKGKVTVQKKENVAFSDITKAQVVIKF